MATDFFEHNQTWAAQEFKGELHIIPKGDPRPHRLFDCWCSPKLDKNKRALAPVWIHKAEDGRENEVW
jgi:hypothetical protein